MGRRWDMDDARGLAAVALSDSGRRWLHVRTVGLRAETLLRVGSVGVSVALAAWLHDIGYAPVARQTGFHPLDGARHLSSLGAPREVVSLVAYHSGSDVEAEERGLSSALRGIPMPDAADRDLLTFLDMTSGPDGELVCEYRRLTEILRRYPAGHPVHRAVSRSRPQLLDSCRRARSRLRLTDVGTLPRM